MPLTSVRAVTVWGAVSSRSSIQLTAVPALTVVVVFMAPVLNPQCMVVPVGGAVEGATHGLLDDGGMASSVAVNPGWHMHAKVQDGESIDPLPEHNTLEPHIVEH